MGQGMTECQERLLEKYAGKAESKRDEMALLAVGMGANSFGFEAEIMDFLEKYPKATLQELEEYAKQFFPEIEISDDEED